MLQNILHLHPIRIWGACLTAILLAAGCVDEELGDFSGTIPDGETTVAIQAAFSPFAAADIESRATLTPPGQAMTDLSDLVLLAYDKSGNLMSGVGPLKIDFTSADIKDEDRNDNDASNGHKAEESTKCLTSTITLPFGEYYLIAVANLGRDYSGEPGSITAGRRDTYYELTDPDGLYYGRYATLSDLRNIKVDWDENYRLNREMLGFFTTDSDADTPRHNSGFRMARIDRAGLTLKAWLRRCVSKVTIDFDGSGLRENVHVYIKSARIYDIPATCTLGFGLGTTGDDNGMPDFNNHPADASDITHENSQVIEYGDGDDFSRWPAISKGSPYITETVPAANADEAAEENKKDLHTPVSPALFFYENMQGDAPNGKIPVADLIGGGVAGADIAKDGVPYGTYIEVVAHYYSNASGNISQGDIRYRFMLGKDAAKSCDAERNYHYKLTLRLRGNANDHDWHIDYKEQDGFDLPNPWYVPYLYNHSAIMPFKYTPPKGYKVVRLEAEILTNPWYPANGIVPDGEQSAPYTTDANKNNGNGFLSLHATDKPVVTLNDTGYPELLNNGAFAYSDAKTPKVNEAYYLGKSPSNSTINRSRRTYYFDGTDDPTNTGPGKYDYIKDGEKLTFNIPLFTRAKVLVKQTGYSGNNPFVGYERHAKLKITATLQNIDNPDDKKEEWDTTTVKQVRRIVNPKGVYRKAGNNEDFSVTLLHLPGDDADEFVEFRSDGPWMAEVLGDRNFITLDGRQSVTGSTGSFIKFKIKFNRLNNNPEDKTIRNAVVRVRYHNYTCTHLIFVRQGYEPQAISPDGTNMNGSGQKATKWTTFNTIVGNIVASDPRDEGSLFKFGNIWQGIDAYGNVYTRNNSAHCGFPTDSEFGTPPAMYLAAADGSHETTAKTWGDIWYNTAGFTDRAAATARDFEQLYLTPHVEFGYGVLYADGATETQTNVDKAYGWYRRDKGTGPDNTKGMRGMFAYFWNPDEPTHEFTGKNVFFPIGRSGYGHRKHAKGIDLDGTLRYSCNRDSYASVFINGAPLFCHLYRRPGAIYYAKVPSTTYLGWDGATNSDTFFGLDINYFTFDVGAITSSNVGNGTDACFVRYVK